MGLAGGPVAGARIQGGGEDLSLRDIDARAMAVKTLTKGELQRLHEAEEKGGLYFLPFQVARFSSACDRAGGSLRKHWGIPESSVNQAQHSERISDDVTSLMRGKKCFIDLTDQESRVNFDWHIFHSDIDFAFNGVKRITAEEDPFNG